MTETFTVDGVTKLCACLAALAGAGKLAHMALMWFIGRCRAAKHWIMGAREAWEKLHGIDQQIAQVRTEMLPNGGASFRDAIDRIDERSRANREDFEALKGHVTSTNEKLTDLIETRSGQIDGLCEDVATIKTRLFDVERRQRNEPVLDDKRHASVGYQ